MNIRNQTGNFLHYLCPNSIISEVFLDHEVELKANVMTGEKQLVLFGSFLPETKSIINVKYKNSDVKTFLNKILKKIKKQNVVIHLFLMS